MTNNLLKFRVFGQGYPVLFLHGFLESKSMWLNFDLESFNFKSIIIDLPGHGDSSIEDDKDPSIEYMVVQVLEIVKSLKIEKFSIVGHSMGGYVALGIKERLLKCSQKELNCFKVILLNSNFWDDSELKKRERLRIVDIVIKNKGLFIREAIPNLFSNKNNFKNDINQLIKSALNMDKFAIVYASLAMRNRVNQTEMLASNESDFLIVQGQLDSIIPLDIMLKNVNDLGCKVEIIPNVGHMAHLESTSKVENILANFLIDLG